VRGKTKHPRLLDHTYVHLKIKEAAAVITRLGGLRAPDSLTGKGQGHVAKKKSMKECIEASSDLRRSGYVTEWAPFTSPVIRPG
jgi:hypothetical protein